MAAKKKKKITKTAKKKEPGIEEVAKSLREYALGLPGAREDFPWGERVIKVGKKVFVFMGKPIGGFGLSVKLPRSQKEALALPFTEPTGYGLGKSGWVSCSFAEDDHPPSELLRAWIEESFRAIAPKRLVAELDG